jgi:hypothetical protein
MQRIFEVVGGRIAATYDDETPDQLGKLQRAISLAYDTFKRWIDFRDSSAVGSRAVLVHVSSPLGLCFLPSDRRQRCRPCPPRVAIVRRRSRGSFLGFISLTHRVPYPPFVLRPAKTHQPEHTAHGALEVMSVNSATRTATNGGVGVRDTPRASCVPIGDV